MRELKFRAWDKHNKIFLYTGMFNIRIDTGDLQVNGSDGVVGGVEISQFTGLQDKNGKDIYEGDVLQYADITTDKWLILGEKTIGVVKWKQGDCSLSPQDIEQNHKNGNYYAYWGFIEQIEIIGNIYENPELLEDK